MPRIMKVPSSLQKAGYLSPVFLGGSMSVYVSLFLGRSMSVYVSLFLGRSMLVYVSLLAGECLGNGQRSKTQCMNYHKTCQVGFHETFHYKGNMKIWIPCAQFHRSGIWQQANWKGTTYSCEPFSAEPWLWEENANPESLTDIVPSSSPQKGSRSVFQLPTIFQGRCLWNFGSVK